ncbi:MAG: glycosyltransferase family 9 protein [Planctomycetes bacterium]|nr:glycosyltransferase family 9 protein [Planctomycetota bacterium]
MSTPRVLLRLPNWLGDAVMATPVVEALARAHGAGLTVVGPSRWLELLDPVLGQAPLRVPLAKGGLPARHARGHAAALLLDGSTRSAWGAWLAGVGSVACLSTGGRGLLASLALRPARLRGAGRPEPRPFGAVAVELLARLPQGLGAELPGDPAPRLPVPAASAQRARELCDSLGLGEAFVLVNAGARPGSAKGLPPEVLSAVLSALASRGLGALVVVGPGEAARLEGVELAGARSLGEPAPDLGLLAALGRAARLTVTADGGGRHLVRAAGGRTLTLFGPTDPRHSAMPGPREEVLRISVPCGPCHREICPLPGDGGRLACFLGLAEQVGPALEWALAGA